MDQDRRAGRRLELFDQVFHRLGRLHHQLGGAVAADAPTPHRLVIGRQIELDEDSLPRIDDLARLLSEILVEAAPRDRADAGPIGTHELTGAQPAVGRSANSDDCGEGKSHTPPRPVSGRLQDAFEFGHRCSVSPPRSCRTWGSTGRRASRFSRAPLGEPGKLTTRLSPTVPAVPRDKAAIGVDSSPRAIISCTSPGARRSRMRSVASGVTSRGPKPVPPVVATTRADFVAESNSSVIASASSGTTDRVTSVAPASRSSDARTSPDSSRRAPLKTPSETVRTWAVHTKWTLQRFHERIG